MLNVVKEPKKSFWSSGSGTRARTFNNTWEPEKHLTHCEDLLADYWANAATFPQGVREKQAELKKKRKTAALERNRSVEQTQKVTASEPAGRRRVSPGHR
jgi:hypothetical protein